MMRSTEADNRAGMSKIVPAPYFEKDNKMEIERLRKLKEVDIKGLPFGSCFIDNDKSDVFMITNIAFDDDEEEDEEDDIVCIALNGGDAGKRMYFNWDTKVTLINFKLVEIE